MTAVWQSPIQPKTPDPIRELFSLQDRAHIAGWRDTTDSEFHS